MGPDSTQVPHVAIASDLLVCEQGTALGDVSIGSLCL